MFSIIFALAILCAVIINDILLNNKSKIALHGSLGAVVVGLLFILWYMGYELIGWGLILLPIITLTVSYIFVAIGTKPATSPTLEDSIPETPTPELECGQYNPAGPYVAVAAPPKSTISLPATNTSITTAPTNPTVSAKPVPTFNITPIGGC